MKKERNHNKKAATIIAAGSLGLLGVSSIVSAALKNINAGDFNFDDSEITNNLEMLPTQITISSTVTPTPSLDINETVTATPTLTAIHSQSSGPTATPTPQKTTKYLDGTYTTQVSYFVEGHREVMDIVLTIQNDTVTGYTINRVSGSNQSLIYINTFYSESNPKVVGSSLDSNFSNTRVSGATLVYNAFLQAVSSTKTKAQ